jgi:hypothetical protein
MRHIWRGAGSLVIVVAVLGLLSPVARAAERRSGTVVSVDDRSGTIVIDEIGPWRVEKGVTQVTRHSIVVTAATKITSHVRVNVPGRFSGDFIDVALELADVSPGDIVTVECRRERGRLVASSIDVAELESTVALP